jgi:hypothetical protein
MSTRVVLAGYRRGTKLGDRLYCVAGGAIEDAQWHVAKVATGALGHVAQVALGHVAPMASGRSGPLGYRNNLSSSFPWTLALRASWPLKDKWTKGQRSTKLSLACTSLALLAHQGQKDKRTALYKTVSGGAHGVRVSQGQKDKRIATRMRCGVYSINTLDAEVLY